MLDNFTDWRIFVSAEAAWQYLSFQVGQSIFAAKWQTWWIRPPRWWTEVFHYQTAELHFKRWMSCYVGLMSSMDISFVEQTTTMEEESKLVDLFPRTSSLWLGKMQFSKLELCGLQRAWPSMSASSFSFELSASITWKKLVWRPEVIV